MRKLSVWCKKAKIAMIRQDLTVNELAKALGRSRCYTSSILNGSREKIAIRKQISDFLNITDSDEE